MKHVIILLVFALLVSVFGSAAAWAQATAQISGTVKDQSGAVLPGVEITATQTQTGVARNTVTNETGSYVLPSLPTGPYRMEAALPGFRTYVQNGIELQVNSNPVINPVLEVGQVSEQVEVQANASLVETRTSGIGQVVETERILELPLNGRSVQDLVLTSPATIQNPSGANVAQGTTAVFNRDGAVNVAGGFNWGVAYTLDGAVHNNAWNGQNISVPFPDALQEFKVETSALSAQSGMHSAGAVSLVTKSGTNEIHGDAFEFVRNGKFNARNPFALARDTLKRNQFGGTIGGPILKNKLFAFGGYQGTRVRSDPSDRLTFVPTAQMLAGDFTTITSPACNAGRTIALRPPFVNSRIDPALFSPIALKVVSLLPKAQDACGTFRYGVRSPENYNMEVAKVDYQLTSKHSVFGRYLLDKGGLIEPNQWTSDKTNYFASNIQTQKATQHAFTVGDTFLFGANIVNSFRATVNRGDAIILEHQDLTSWAKLGVKMYGYPDAPYIGLTVTGGPSLQASGGGAGQLTNTVHTWGFNDDVSWIYGKHQLGFGGQVSRMNTTWHLQGIDQGGANFTGQVLGLGLADFLTGNVSTWSQSNPVHHDNAQWFYANYATDTWKATQTLTLNYGIRWEPFFPVEWSDGTAYLLDLNAWRKGIKTPKFTNAPAGLFFPGDPGVNDRSAQVVQWKSFSPRVGLAWDVKGDGRTSVRAAYGLFYDFTPMAMQIGTNNAPPYQPRISISNVRLDDPWAAYPGGNPFPVSTASDALFPAYGPYAIIRPDLKPSQISQWNLSIQRQVGTDWLVSASYLGSHTAHMWSLAQRNSAVFLGLGPCTLAGVQYATCSTPQNQDARRLLSLENPAASRAFGPVNEVDDGAGASYNGLVMSLQRRATRGISLAANYTWSHCIADSFTALINGGTANGGYSKPNDRRFDRGNCSVSAVDRRHLFGLSGVFESPTFSNSMVQKLAGGWKLSPILSIRTGTFMTVTTNTDVALNAIGNQRLNQVLANVYGDKTVGNYLNPAAFAVPAAGTIGNMGGANIQGPGWWTLNVALSRSVKVGESQRVEFRAEAFNLTNSVRLPNPTTNYSMNTFGQIVNPGSTGFSSTVSSVSDPRLMQFALKYVF